MKEYGSDAKAAAASDNNVLCTSHNGNTMSVNDSCGLSCSLQDKTSCRIKIE